MAPGWESKAVDDQIAAAAERSSERARALTEVERERASRRAVFQAGRARLLEQLQTACDARYRAQLETALAHVDAEIAAVDES
jgi:hypothetical protein